MSCNNNSNVNNNINVNNNGNVNNNINVNNPNVNNVHVNKVKSTTLITSTTRRQQTAICQIAAATTVERRVATLLHQRVRYHYPDRLVPRPLTKSGGICYGENNQPGIDDMNFPAGGVINGIFSRDFFDF